jgi:hypothetical protein
MKQIYIRKSFRAIEKKSSKFIYFLLRQINDEENVANRLIVLL